MAEMTPGGKKTEHVKVWMSDELLLGLTKLATAEDRTISEYIRITLSKHVFGHRRPDSEGEPANE